MALCSKRNLNHEDIDHEDMLPRRPQPTQALPRFMAAFPKDEARAEELIYNSAITAALAGATRMMTKTLIEASRIPVATENARGLAIAQSGLRAARARFDNLPAVNFEKELLELEVTQIMDRIEELGNNSIARGAIRALQEGFLDIPFSRNVHNRNEVVTFRDRSGAIRYGDCGQLPFNSFLKDFHQARKEERMTLERDTKLFSRGERFKPDLEKRLSRLAAG